MDLEEVKQLISSLRESNPSLVNLSVVCDKLASFVADAEISLDLSIKIDSLTDQISQFKTVNSNLNQRMGTVEIVLKTQQDQLFLSDEEHKQMVTRVHAVLGQLEEYLTRHT